MPSGPAAGSPAAPFRRRRTRGPGPQQPGCGFEEVSSFLLCSDKFLTFGGWNCLSGGSQRYGKVVSCFRLEPPFLSEPAFLPPTPPCGLGFPCRGLRILLCAAGPARPCLWGAKPLEGAGGRLAQAWLAHVASRSSFPSGSWVLGLSSMSGLLVSRAHGQGRVTLQGTGPVSCSLCPAARPPCLAPSAHAPRPVHLPRACTGLALAAPGGLSNAPPQPPPAEC